MRSQRVEGVAAIVGILVLGVGCLTVAVVFGTYGVALLAVAFALLVFTFLGITVLRNACRGQKGVSERT